MPTQPKGSGPMVNFMESGCDFCGVRFVDVRFKSVILHFTLVSVATGVYYFPCTDRKL